MTLAREIAHRIAALPQRTIAPLRALRREYSKRLRDRSGREVLDVAFALLPEHRFVAYELIEAHREAATLLDAPLLTRLGRGMDTWDAVDMFSVFLAGPACRNGQIDDATIASWARSRDRWWRRAALVATVPLNLRSRGGAGDARRTLAVCRMLVTDRDDMVVKAMSWALRELAKHEAAAVRAFVAEHEAELAARVLREVRKKLATGRKT